MAISLEKQPQVARAIRPVLDGLRSRIRVYVWLHGLTAALTWLGAAFWASLAIDWFFEPPPAVRAAMLAVAGVVLLAILVRLVVRRAFVRMTDSNMAMVLERRFPQLDDSLLTAVVLGQRQFDPRQCNPEMFVHTCREAVGRIGIVRLRRVFNYRPLRRTLAGAVLFSAAILAFGLLYPDAMSTWARRVLGLGHELWPRKVRLEIEGFTDGVRKVARGADTAILVKADTHAPLVPQTVEIRYRTESGARDRVAMSREGVADPMKDDYQNYSYTFESVLAPIRFDVIGGDARLRDLKIVVVDRPTVSNMVLDCRYPAYTGRSDRSFPVTGVMPLPLGTEVTVTAWTNKQLRRVRIDSADAEAASAPVVLEADQLPPERRSFRHTLAPLAADTTLLFTLEDTDEIRSPEPVRLALVGVPDEPPQLAVRLDGIGTAITPTARLPLVGTITDDFGIDRVWSEAAVDDKAPVEAPLGNPADHPINVQLAQQAVEAQGLSLAPGQKLLVSVKAADRYDLGPSGPNVGTSERWLLDVVTPEQLRAMLEARELVLRQRFEVIIGEVTETRDLLLRLDFADQPEASLDTPAADAGGAGDDPAAEAAEADAESPADALERKTAVRRLRVQRAVQNCRKNAHETLAVAEAFDDIHKQLVNNRIDTEELKKRIDEGIARPLHGIAEDMFPDLERRLERLEEAVADLQRGPKLGEEARQQADEVLLAMRQVLGRMLELEDFNEAVELLRLIIKLQDDLDEQTKARLKQQLRELLEE